MSTVAINIGRVVFDFSADSASRYSVVLVGVYFGPILDLPIKFEEPSYTSRASRRAIGIALLPHGPRVVFFVLDALPRAIILRHLLCLNLSSTFPGLALEQTLL